LKSFDHDLLLSGRDVFRGVFIVATAALHEISSDHTFPRTIGQVAGKQPGPSLVCIGAMHGNEPAGVHAIRRVLDRLEQGDIPVRGNFFGLIGNTQAFSESKRFTAHDLNRLWTPERMQELENKNTGMKLLQAEEREQLELFRELKQIMAQTRGELHFLDLHTTSAQSAPFGIFGDTLRNREFARNLPVPLVLGLEEALSGVMIEYLTNLGYIAVAFESGQHDARESVDNHESAIWISLVAAGLIDRTEAPDMEGHVKRLQRAANGLPHFFEVRYRRAISPRDHFQMKPGYKNFQPVEKGKCLATDRRGAVRAPYAAHILMPLYQGLGEDGYFLARPVKPLWLKISAFLRKLKLDRLVPLLPGVRQDPAVTSQLVVNRKIARYYPTEIAHLLGFRKKTIKGNALYVNKRSFSIKAPAR